MAKGKWKEGDPVPPNETLPQQTERLRRATDDISYYVESDSERECPTCGSINPCTGVDCCTSCQNSLDGARRLPRSHRFDPSKY